jgi:single-strand DNA-binding protein
MASVNKVILIGNLGRDPEVRYSPSGTAVCNITIATSRRWKDKTSGDAQEETEWHRVVLYDRQAEVAGQYLKKGRPVYIEGRLKTRKWTDKDGVERYTTEVIASDLKFLGGREEGDAPQQRQATPAQQPSAEQRHAQASKPATKTNFDDMEDDIPF